MATFFLKNKKYSNPECFIRKRYRQRFFRCKDFNYKRPLFFELWAVELAISFY